MFTASAVPMERPWYKLYIMRVKRDILPKIVLSISDRLFLIYMAFLLVSIAGNSIPEEGLQVSNPVPSSEDIPSYRGAIAFAGYCVFFLVSLYLASATRPDGTAEALQVVGERMSSLYVPRVPDLPVEVSPIRAHGYFEW
jgi:hypothetical protein